MSLPRAVGFKLAKRDFNSSFSCSTAGETHAEFIILFIAGTTFLFISSDNLAVLSTSVSNSVLVKAFALILSCVCNQFFIAGDSSITTPGVLNCKNQNFLSARFAQSDSDLPSFGICISNIFCLVTESLLSRPLGSK